MAKRQSWLRYFGERANTQNLFHSVVMLDNQIRFLVLSAVLYMTWANPGVTSVHISLLNGMNFQDGGGNLLKADQCDNSLSPRRCKASCTGTDTSDKATNMKLFKRSSKSYCIQFTDERSGTMYALKGTKSRNGTIDFEEYNCSSKASGQEFLYRLQPVSGGFVRFLIINKDSLCLRANRTGTLSFSSDSNDRSCYFTIVYY